LVSGERKKAVLVMDDEDMVGEIVCQMLQYLGLEAVRVANGADAIVEYKKRYNGGITFDAVIMDLTIPGGMGGKETVTEILAIDKEANVFVSSGYSNDPIMVNYKDYGFVGVIAKPFDMTAIQKTLAMLL
jgi:CheY-like chemotaxis protein